MPQDDVAVQKGSTLRLLGLLKSHQKKVVFLVSLVVVAAGVDILVPLISQKLIDILISFFTQATQAPIRILILSALGILVATVTGSIIRSIYDYHLFRLVTTVEDETRYKAFEKYLRLHALFHYGSSSGQLIGRIDRGTASIFTVLYNTFGQNLLPSTIVYLSVLVTLFLKQPLIALVVLLPLPIYTFVVRNLVNRIYEIQVRSNEAFELVKKEEYDVASNVLTVKKFSQEKLETANQKRLQRKARGIEYTVEKLWTKIESIQSFVAASGRILVIIVGGMFVLKGQHTVGEFVLFMTLQGMAYSPLARLSYILPQFRRHISKIERVFAVLDEPIHVSDKEDAIKLPPLSREIEFRNVSFKYSDTKDWAAKDISIKIPAGKTVALVGRSGSGKTTFINLLLRSYDPQKGAILIDGHDIRDVTQESLRQQIAVVPQEVDLFSRTIRQNIAYGKPDVNEEEIIRAAQTALSHDFIMHLPDKYETVVGERGIKLSGGERQRVGIARAILRDPRILILDEATSHLDTESEQLIQKATNALIKDRTSIIIAHRLSTVINADLILVFDQGSIHSAGTHQELMEKSSIYQRLHGLQFADA